jgi:REP element-mobilizing transposase RayT
MKRQVRQALLPFGRKERLKNRQLRQRQAGKRATPGPGRPRQKDAGVSHQRRPTLSAKSAVHVTLRTRHSVPNLRTRRRFSAIKQAFVRFAAPKPLGFRLVHFAVLGNHLHFIVEADNKAALSLGMQKLLHSISRRLNALSVFENGGRVSTKGGRYQALRGWLGRIFADRYHAHLLQAPTEMANAVRYVLHNAERHYGPSQQRDPFTSLGASEDRLTAKPEGFLLIRACRQQHSQRIPAG